MNSEEAYSVIAILEKFRANRIASSRIGIITPYSAQKELIEQKIRCSKNRWYDDVKIASVDGFQGSELDYIIFTCVRNNKKKSVGFLGDSRRLNVALSRARYGLILVGNVSFMEQFWPWNEVIKYFRDQKAIVNC
jgi:regulator of nonsense transcripts 1